MLNKIIKSVSIRIMTIHYFLYVVKNSKIRDIVKFFPPLRTPRGCTKGRWEDDFKIQLNPALYPALY